MSKSKKVIFNNSLPANVAAAALIIIITLVTLISAPYGVSERVNNNKSGEYSYTATFQSNGSMLSSSSASIPAITETPQAAPAAKGGSSLMFVKLSASSLLKQRDIENIYRLAVAISGEAKSASLEPLKRYFVFAIREIII